MAFLLSMASWGADVARFFPSSASLATLEALSQSPNGTAVAASANVVGIGLAARSGHKITFWHFTKYGILTTVFTTIIAWIYIYLRYIAFA